MKSCKYNYVIPYKGKHLVFNGMTRRWILLSDKEAVVVGDILNSPDRYFHDGMNSKLCQKLLLGGFILTDNKDELQNLYHAYEKYRTNKHAHICVMTTYDCNLRCWYCVQKHKEEYMNEDVQKRTKNLIKKTIEEGNLESFSLSWFGGEPLLHPNVIYDISVYAMDLCQKHNIPFTNNITTNGTLINDELIDIFKSINLRNFQITIDGNKEYHNKVKRTKNITDTYETVCLNIKNLLDNLTRWLN